LYANNKIGKRWLPSWESETTNENVRKEMSTVKDDRCAFLMSTTITSLWIPTLDTLKNKCANEQKKKSRSTMMMMIMMIWCLSVTPPHFFFYDLWRQMSFACLVYLCVWMNIRCVGTKWRSFFIIIHRRYRLIESFWWRQVSFILSSMGVNAHLIVFFRLDLLCSLLNDYRFRLIWKENSFLG
jgi:hypothetical protein